MISVPSVVQLFQAGQAASTGPTQSFDLQTYRAELERWSESVNRLREHPEEAPVLRKELPDFWTVTVQEQRFLVSTQAIKSALDRVVQDPDKAVEGAQEISSQVESLSAEARALSGASVRDDGSARAKLDNILKRREFRFAAEPDEAESFWNVLEDKARQWIEKLLNRAGRHPRAANYLRWGIVIALGLICLVWLVYTLAHIPSAGALAPKATTPAQPPHDGVRQARETAAQGEYREAIRMIYGAAVLRLGEYGAWRVDPSRTHREYLRLLPSDSALRPHLAALTDSFEQVWYGSARASVAEYEAALAELESLE